MFDETMDPISEVIDQHVESNHDAVALVAADGPAVPGTFAFCVVYSGVRPVLHWVKAVLFLKPKWRAMLTALIAGLDAICKDKAETTEYAQVGGQPSNNGAAIDMKDESLQGE